MHAFGLVQKIRFDSLDVMDVAQATREMRPLSFAERDSQQMGSYARGSYDVVVDSIYLPTKRYNSDDYEVALGFCDASGWFKAILR